MKPKFKLSLLLAASAVAIVGCSMFGANPSAPTKAESLIFNTTTSSVPVVIPAYVTNQQVITQITTNNVTLTVTNFVPVTVPAQTNQQPAYTETVKPGVTGVLQAAGAVLNTFFPGIGSIVATGVTGLIGAWAYGRSQKQGANTTSALAAEIQVARQLIQQVPNGAALDNEFVNWIQAHQADAGILEQVMGVVENEINSNSGSQGAATAAQEIASTVAALVNATSPPPGTPIPPVAPKA